MTRQTLKLLPLLFVCALFLASSLARRERPEGPDGPVAEAPAPPARLLNGEVAPGQVLGAIFDEAGLAPARARELTAAFGEVFDLRRLRPGDRWKLALDEEDAPLFFRYQPGPLAFYEVVPDPANGAYTARRREVAAETVVLGAAGRLSSSLYRDLTALGVPAQTVVRLAAVFASRLDFLTDPREGDLFSVAWEARVVDGETVAHGRLLAAEYVSGRRTHRAFHYRGVDGEDGYFDAAGESLETAFLRAPLEYRRISSHFTHRRLHPVHRVYRPHLGIDYAAPAGTPVSAIGAGRVLEAGWRNCGFGNTVRIQHPNGYISYYGHLSRFASGLRPGRRVARGELIGYVGATGTATGPHLDFRIRKDGRFVNFLTLDLPPAFVLADEDRPLFEQRRAALEDLLEPLREDGFTGRLVLRREPPPAPGDDVASGDAPPPPGRA